jgi:TfoX/Sxy family transcriptional regulator of competence genes
MSDAGFMNARKMFGEYAIYCNDKVVALVCDDQLFVKPTPAGEALLSSINLQPPYPGSKPYFLIEPDLWEDRQWLSKLIADTAEALPMAKKKSMKKRE